MQLKVEKLVYGGDGLARLPADEHGRGKTVFVPFILENERVEATLFEEKRGFARARLDQVLQSSPDRRQPACPYFQRCGGCHYQHSSYEHQLQIKADILRETVRRTAKLELPGELTIHASPEWNYRNRTRLKVQTRPEFALGYYKFRSHDLLPVEECPISSPLINRAIAAIWEAGRTIKIFEALREVEFFADPNDGTMLVEAYCAPGTPRSDAHRVVQELAQRLPEVKGSAALEQLPANSFSEPKHLANTGATNLQYQTKAACYQVSTGSFFQVNRFLVDELTDTVCASVSGEFALDLYAGVGLFSKLLARSFAQVIAVEASQTAHSDLRHNCGPEVKAVLATTEQYLKQASSELRPDLVVADPPRGGLGENVVRSLARMKAQGITYVSCDPSTLARDLRGLVEAGYKIEQAHLFDMFPQTYHIESVFHLAR